MAPFFTQSAAHCGRQLSARRYSTVPLIGVRAFSFSLLKLISVFFFFTDEIE
jgi:hypothetical protein